MNWNEAEILNQNEKILNAGNHVVMIPSQETDAPLDTMDLFDGNTNTFIAVAVPEKSARDFTDIWNGLVDSGEPVEAVRHINLAWLTGVSGKVYKA